MKNVDIKELEKFMKKCQDKKRFHHTLGVAYTAAALAMRYETDVSQAQTAGLLHDCAKCIPENKMLSLCEKYKISISDAERKSPYLLHGKLGAYLAEEKYGINDEGILEAVRYHTTGKPDMKLLEKIIFVADYIEPQRKTAPNLVEIRKTAFMDLDKAMVMILQNTLDYLQKSGKPIDHTTEETYNYYVKQQKEQTN